VPLKYLSTCFYSTQWFFLGSTMRWLKVFTTKQTWESFLLTSKTWGYFMYTSSSMNPIKKSFLRIHMIYPPSHKWNQGHKWSNGNVLDN
jgi:hypothetical protein